MGDETTTVKELRGIIASFVEERQWKVFHTPKNLAVSIAIEAAELMEIFQWSDEHIPPGEEQLKRLREELADVVIYCLAAANASGIDLSTAVREKVQKNAARYPAERFRGTI